MACFIVPAVEAGVTTVITKMVESKEKKADIVKAKEEHYSANLEADTKIPFSRKLKWLNNLLWGGSFLLAFEHLWSGEVVPWFPFLTATETAEATAAMLREMATSGVAMAALVTVVWAGMVLVSNAQERRISKETTIRIKEGAV